MDVSLLLEVISYVTVAAGAGSKAKDFLRYFRQEENVKSVLRLSSLFRERYSDRIKELEKQEDSIRSVRFKSFDTTIEVKKVVRAYAQIADLDTRIVERLLDEPSQKKEGFEQVHLKSILAPDEFIIISSERRESNKIWNAAILGANSGLLMSTVLGRIAVGSRSAIDRSTIVGMLLGEKMKTYTRAYLYLLAGFILTAIANQLGFLDDPVPSYIAAAAFMIILYLNQWALGYRVRNNLYGTAPTEVREIIAYIGAHSDKSDFMDDGKSKRFAPHFEEKEARVRYFSGEVA